MRSVGRDRDKVREMVARSGGSWRGARCGGADRLGVRGGGARAGAARGRGAGAGAARGGRAVVGRGGGARAFHNRRPMNLPAARAHGEGGGGAGHPLPGGQRGVVGLGGHPDPPPPNVVSHAEASKCRRVPPRKKIEIHDYKDWLSGNPNRGAGVEVPAGDVDACGSGLAAEGERLLHSTEGLPPVAEQLPRRRTRRADEQQFNEVVVFKNQYKFQTPDVNTMNEDLVILFESISVVRERIHGMMCSIAAVRDPESFGKAISEETRKAHRLLKEAEYKQVEIRAAQGVPTPIPPHFYVPVKLE